MAPLYQLGRARWNLVLGRESAAEKDLDSGLTISEEVRNSLPRISHFACSDWTTIECEGSASRKLYYNGFIPAPLRGASEKPCS